MNTFDDLPTHPMFVHIPIVLGPLLAIAMVWMAIRPGTVRRRGVLLAIANLLLVGFLVLLVRPSGLFLERELMLDVAIARHEELGMQTIWLSVAMFLASAAMAWSRWRIAPHAAAPAGDTPARSSATGVMQWSDLAARAIGAVVAVLLVVWMVRTGHSGAGVVWRDTVGN